jgi:hypothetical protein
MEDACNPPFHDWNYDELSRQVDDSLENMSIPPNDDAYGISDSIDNREDDDDDDNDEDGIMNNSENQANDDDDDSQDDSSYVTMRTVSVPVSAEELMKLWEYESAPTQRKELTVILLAGRMAAFFLGFKGSLDELFDSWDIIRYTSVPSGIHFSRPLLRTLRKGFSAAAKTQGDCSIKFDTFKKHCSFLRRVVVAMRLDLNFIGIPSYEDLKTHFTTLKTTDRLKLQEYVNIIEAKFSKYDAKKRAAPKTKTAASKRTKAAAAAPVETPLNHLQVKPFDRTLLLKGNTNLFMAVEKNIDGMKGAPGELFPIVKSPDATDWIESMYIFKIMPETVYIADNLKESHHGMVLESELGRVILACQRNDVNVHLVNGKGWQDPAGFLSVINGGTKAYEELFGFVSIDVEAVLDRILKMVDDGSTSVICDKQGKRGNITVNCGFGNQSYDSSVREGTIMSKPRMINRKEECELLYQNAGPVLDLLKTAMDKCLGDKRLGFDKEANFVEGDHGGGDRPTHNEAELRQKEIKDKRQKEFAEELKNATGAVEAFFEGFTFAVNCLGPETEEDGGLREEHMEHLLTRHVDSLNDDTEGYTHTAVWSVVVVLRDTVYRLALIGYTRSSVGCFMVKECGYAGELETVCRVYLEQAEGNTVVDCVDPIFDDKPISSKRDDRLVMSMFIKPAAGNRLVFMSAFVDTFLVFLEETGLSIDSQRAIELAFIAMQENSVVRYRYTLFAWKDLMRERNHPLFGCNLVMEYGQYWDKDLQLEGFKGNYERSGSLLCGWWWNKGLPDSDNECEADIKYHLTSNLLLFGEVLQGARVENQDPKRVWSHLREIYMFRHMACLAFYPFIVLSGMVTNPSALRFATMSPINKDSSYASELAKLGCETEGKQRAVVKRVAFKLNVSVGTVENILCEVYRRHKKMDVKFQNQKMFDIIQTGHGKEAEFNIHQTIFHVAV